MRSDSRSIVAALLAAMLGGCASHVSAPIDSRGNQSSAGTKTTQKTSARTSNSKQPGYYVVQGGDTLYSIAWQQGLNYRELARINGIRPPYTIYKGQRLRVKPKDGQTVAMSAALQPKPVIKASPAAPVAPPARPVAKPVPKPVPAAIPAAVSQSAPVEKQQVTVPAYDGKWVWPTRGRVLTRFQSSGPGKQGIDIGGHANQPVKAAANGKVVYAGSGLVGYGRLIIVKHNENLLSAYGHNNQLLVNEGEHVAAGQMIAKMGSSGTNRNELYFEIRKNGKPTDPLRYLPKQ
jgi:lipoprotein NlpD